MRTIGRDSELKRLREWLVEARRLGGVRGALHSLHAVSAPSRGGVTTFLKDLVEVLAKGDGFLPAFVSIVDGLSPGEVDKAFDQLISQVRDGDDDDRGREIDAEGRLHQLFDACNRWKPRGLLPVAILDLAEGFRTVQRAHGSLQVAGRAPLLQRLRVLANQIQDSEPNLAVVVGWDNEFAAISPSWRAEDVVQRYPATTLWPDFGRQDAWPVYADILRMHGYRTDGAYPGFARAGIPVGVLIDELEAAGRREPVDGRFLLDVLRRSKTFDSVIDRVPPAPLVSLCLQDQTLAPTSPHYGVVTGPELESYVEPTADGSGYIANESLYEALGLQPAKVILSLERQLRQQYEEGPSGERCLEVAQGVASIAGDAKQTVGEPYEALDHARLTFCLRSEFLPPGCREMQVTVVIALGHQGMSEELQGELVELLAGISAEPGGRAKRLVILAHRVGYDEIGFLGSLATALEARGRPVLPDSKFRGSKKAPVGLCTLQLDADRVVQAVYRARDPKRSVSELGASVRDAISFHMKRVHKEFVLLSADAFDQLVLPLFVRFPHRRLGVEDVHAKLSATGISIREIKDRVRNLVTLRVLQDNGDGYAWRYGEDELLGAVSENGSRDAMLAQYFFDAIDWHSIAEAMTQAYGDHFLKYHEGRLAALDCTDRAKITAVSLIAACKEQATRLRDGGETDVARTFLEEVEALEERFNCVAKLPEISALIDELIDKEQSICVRREQLTRDQVQAREELTVLGEFLRATSPTHDPVLDGERTECLRLLDRRSPEATRGALRQAVERLDSLRRSLEEDTRGRQEILSKLKQSHRAHLEPLRRDVNALQRQFEELPEGADREAMAVSINEFSSAYGHLRKRLEGWQKTAPSIPLTEWRGEFEASLSEIGELRGQLPGLRRRLEGVSKRVATRRTPRQPATTTNPAVSTPVARPQSQPEATEGTTEFSNAPDTGTAEGGSTNVDAKETSEDLPPPPTTETANAPGAPGTIHSVSVTDNEVGRSTNTADESSEAPPTVPVVPTVSEGTGKSELRRYDVTFTADQLDELAALLKGSARIDHVEIDE